MSTGISNRFLAYRPLLGGVAIQNDVVGKLGTLGFIATSNGTDRWIVSNYHVLCRTNGAFPNGVTEPIFQPFKPMISTPVATIDGSKADQAMDVAAALVVGPIAVGRILGLPKLGPVAAPAVGMRVIKAGIATGITEGVITAVGGGEVRIGVPQEFPSNYELTDEGDSGSLWVDAATMSPVALHYSGSDSWIEVALARPLDAVLATLGLQVVSE